MLTKITNYKTQINNNSIKISELQAENTRLMEELEALVKANPQEIINFLLNNSSTEVPSQPTKNIKTIVSVKFNSNNNKTYDYIFASDFDIQPGDMVIVDTPYSGKTEVEVVEVKQVDITKSNIAYKEATFEGYYYSFYTDRRCKMSYGHGPYGNKEKAEKAAEKEFEKYPDGLYEIISQL